MIRLLNKPRTNLYNICINIYEYMACKFIQYFIYKVYSHLMCLLPLSLLSPILPCFMSFRRLPIWFVCPCTGFTCLMPFTIHIHSVVLQIVCACVIADYRCRCSVVVAVPPEHSCLFTLQCSSVFINFSEACAICCCCGTL